MVAIALLIVLVNATVVTANVSWSNSLFDAWYHSIRNDATSFRWKEVSKLKICK